MQKCVSAVLDDRSQRCSKGDGLSVGPAEVF